MYVVVLILLSIVGLYSALALWWRQYTNSKIPPNIPRMKSTPIFGHASLLGPGHFDGEVNKMFSYMRRELSSDIFGLFIFTRPWVVCLDPKHYSKLTTLSERFDDEMNDLTLRVTNVTMESPSAGVDQLKGKEWKHRRKALARAFTTKSLREICKTFGDCAQELVDFWATHEKTPGKPFERKVSTDMTRCTLNIIGKAAFGYNFKALAGGQDELSNAIAKIFEIRGARQMRQPIGMEYLPFIHSTEEKERVDALVTANRLSLDLVRDRKQLRRNGQVGVEGENISLLDMIIAVQEEDPSITDNDLVSEVRTFIGAGHESTSTLLTFALDLLARHQDVQDKVRAEVLKVIGKTDRPTLESVRELEYMTAVIREVFRYYPPAPGTVRAVEQDIEIDGMTVKAGTMLFLTAFLNYRNPKYFDRPDEFLPERWVEGGSAQVSDAWRKVMLPFGGGARKCIGDRFTMLEAPVLLAIFLRNFRVLPAVGRPKPDLIRKRTTFFHFDALYCRLEKLDA